MQSTQHKTFGSPERRREFLPGHAEIMPFSGGCVATSAIPVVGDDPVAVIGWFGASHYAQAQQAAPAADLHQTREVSTWHARWPIAVASRATTTVR